MEWESAACPLPLKVKKAESFLSWGGYFGYNGFDGGKFPGKVVQDHNHLYLGVLGRYYLRRRFANGAYVADYLHFGHEYIEFIVRDDQPTLSETRYPVSNSLLGGYKYTSELGFSAVISIGVTGRVYHKEVKAATGSATSGLDVDLTPAVQTGFGYSF